MSMTGSRKLVAAPHLCGLAQVIGERHVQFVPSAASHQVVTHLLPCQPVSCARPSINNLYELGKTQHPASASYVADRSVQAITKQYETRFGVEWRCI